MSLDAEHIEQLLGKLEELIESAGEEMEVESVHRLRTHSRRLEAIVEALPAPEAAGHRKLVGQLEKVRRRAGRVRDLDVQMEALRSMAVAGEEAQKETLLERLAGAREEAAGRLRRRLDAARVNRLRRGLKRARRSLLRAAGQNAGSEAATEQAVERALRRFQGLQGPLAKLSDAELHAWRIECKHLRYRMEATGAAGAAARLARRFKRIQDAAGKWHDWLTLAESAERLLAGEEAGRLARLLRGRTGRQRRQALRVIAAVREQLAAESREAGYGHRS